MESVRKSIKRFFHPETFPFLNLRFSSHPDRIDSSLAGTFCLRKFAICSWLMDVISSSTGAFSRGVHKKKKKKKKRKKSKKRA
jgi:hypothetical protein